MFVKIDKLFGGIPTMTRSGFDDMLKRRFLSDGGDGSVVSYETSQSGLCDCWWAHVVWASGMRTRIRVVQDAYDDADESADDLGADDVPEGIAFNDPAEVLFDKDDI